MPDREIIIRLSVAIDTLRRQVREAEDVLARKKASLSEAMAHLERELAHESLAITHHSAEPAEVSSPLAAASHDDAAQGEKPLAVGSYSTRGSRRVVEAAVDAMTLHLAEARPRAPADAVKFSGVTAGRSLKDNVKALFEENPMLTFTTAEVLHHTRALKANHDAIRQTLKRLADERVLMREREGIYVLNPVKPARDARAEVRTD